ncbi:MAG: hypothetical protein ABSA47_09210 [Verrucomicrobiota bacterium]
MNQSHLAVSLLSFCLLAPSARAQSADPSIPADDREADAATNAITTESYPANAGATSGSGTYALGKSVSVTAKATNAGAVFVNWTTNGVLASTKKDYKFTVTESQTAVANFDWVLTIKSSPADGGTTSGAGHYTNGQMVTITAVPDACYDFLHWTNAVRPGGITNTTFSLLMVAGETLVANFKLKEDTITISNNPAKAGTTSGGGTKGCGSKVTLTAKAANGYKFIGWSAAGAIVSTRNPYSFTAEGSEAFTANFSDVSKPSLTVTWPTNTEKVDASLLVISGAAKNVLGISNVIVTLNGDPVSVTSSNHWTNWSAGVILSPGRNAISAYAVNYVNHPSRTNNLTVLETGTTGFAPSSLAGLIAQVEPATNSPFQFSFGTATFERFSPQADQGSGVGNYSYTQTGSNTATLVTSDFAPPGQTPGGSTVRLTFTSPSTASFTDTDGNAGTFALSPGLALDVSSQSGWTYTSVDAFSNIHTTRYGDGTFTSTDSLVTNTGACTSTQYGPMAAMIVQTWPDPAPTSLSTNYSMMLFTSRTNGLWYSAHFGAAGGPASYDAGYFTGAYQSNDSRYLAPESLEGLAARVKDNSDHDVYSVTYGQATLSLTTSTNVPSGVANYTYTRLGPNTAQILRNYISPPSAIPDAGNDYLTFHTSSTATWTSTNGGSGTFAFSAAPDHAPAALPENTPISFTLPHNQGGARIFQDGAFTGSPSTLGSGTCTFVVYSPDVAMLTLNYTNEADLGKVEYVQMTYTTSTSGSICVTEGDGTINLGTFSTK